MTGWYRAPQPYQLRVRLMDLFDAHLEHVAVLHDATMVHAGSEGVSNGLLARLEETRQAAPVGYQQLVGCELWECSDHAHAWEALAAGKKQDPRHHPSCLLQCSRGRGTALEPDQRHWTLALLLPPQLVCHGVENAGRPHNGGTGAEGPWKLQRAVRSTRP